MGIVRSSSGGLRRTPQEDLWKTASRAGRIRKGTARTTSGLFPSGAAGSCQGRAGGSWARAFTPWRARKRVREGKGMSCPSLSSGNGDCTQACRGAWDGLCEGEARPCYCAPLGGHGAQLHRRPLLGAGVCRVQGRGRTDTGAHGHAGTERSGHRRDRDILTLPAVLSIITHSGDRL